MSELPIEKLICLSTLHLKRETVERIQNEIGPWYGNEYGAFVYAQDEDILLDAHRGYSKDLATVMAFACQQGLDWVKFDPDGHVLSNLPTYDSEWEDLDE